jgi:hypothetical protein
LGFNPNVFSFCKDRIELLSDESEQILRPAARIKHSMVIHSLRREVNAWKDALSGKYSVNLIQYIKDSEAEIIYSNLSSLKIISLVLYAQEILHCKIVPHFLDDWLSILFTEKRFLFHRQILVGKMKKIFCQSPVGIAISEVMASVYADKYQIPFHFIMHCIPDEAIEKFPGKTNKEHKQIIYAGGLHLSRWKTLVHLSKALALIYHGNFTFSLYCPLIDRLNYEKYFSRFQFIRFMDSVNPIRLQKILHGADVLIHCESFDNSSRQFTRLSISTKIPEYLKEGKLIVAVGPEEIESIGYLARNNAGITISKQDVLLASDILEKIINTTDDFEPFCTNALSLARRNHSYSTLKKKMEMIFT